MWPTNSKDTESSSLIPPDQTCQRFTLAEIRMATRNFDQKLVIGHGGFGKVYKCGIIIGSLVRDVAIKRLESTSNQGATEFETEVKLLSKLRHANLVSLFGYCCEGNEMVLVYEFMPNKTLNDHLHIVDCGLSWIQRLQICIGAARALEYLHTGTTTQQGVAHRDVKTSNILLDANFAAKVSDFGLAKVVPINQTRTAVSTLVKGTIGYIDPSYYHNGILTRKSDVYAFGVVLFEVLSRKKAVDSTLEDHEWSLAIWVKDRIKKGKLNQIIDSRLKGEISKIGLKKFSGLAGQCLHNQPKQRPTMVEVVVRLESILSYEREFINSSTSETTLINKVTSYFTSKANLMPPSLPPSLPPAHVVRSIPKSQNAVLKIFTIYELIIATNNFKDEVHFPALNEESVVHKGWVDERTYAPTECGVGLAIYVTKKDVSMSKLDHKPNKISCPYFAKLLGYCLDEDELFCVYTLSHMTSLDKLLYGEQSGTTLSWSSRLKIALGAAHGLYILHQRNYLPYGIFKPSYISVDTDFNAWLTDFHLKSPLDYYDSYIHEEGLTFYAAPEWRRRQNGGSYETTVFTCSDNDIDIWSEIYSFGVVLMEILAGMKNRPNGKENLVYSAHRFHLGKEELGMIVDPRLQHNNCPPKGAFKLATLACACLETSKYNRPSMEEILNVISDCYQELESN